MNTPLQEPDESKFGIAVFLVILGGIIGGFVSWLLTIIADQKPVFDTPLAAIPASMLFGAVAAFIGIYLLANTDTRAVKRCVAFAILLGLSWQFVIESGELYVRQSLKRREVRNDKATLSAAVEELSQVEKMSPKEQADVFEQIAASSRSLLKNSLKLFDESLARDSRLAVKDAAREIQNTSEKNPQLAITALAQVGQFAIANDAEEVAQVAVDSLRIVADKSDDIGTQQLAYAKLKNFPSSDVATPSSFTEKLRENRAMVAIDIAEKAKQDPSNVKIGNEILLPIYDDLHTAKRMYSIERDKQGEKKTAELILEFKPMIIAHERFNRLPDGA